MIRDFIIMALSLKLNKLHNSVYTVTRKYCENKSIYQRNEEGPKPRIIHGQPYPDWRKRWIDRPGEWKSKLSVFVEKNPNPDFLLALSTLPDLTIEKVKASWRDLKEIQEIENQKYIPKRVAILGSNLAAVHFFTYRQATVRLKDSTEWIAGDITTLNLPDHFVDGYIVEAVDCTNFHYTGIRYEGVQNLMGLNFLKWLCLRNNKFVDVWCLDRIAGQNGKSLEYLDIRGCKLCQGSVYALARMRALKYLLITDPGDNVPLQVALSLLEENNPNLLIKIDEDPIVNTSQ